jgi:hypothetical protein
MSIRKSSILWLVLGVILIVGAVVIRFVILPSISKLPGDLDETVKYEGTVQALNPQAFASNDLGNLLSPEVPITADRSLTVDATDGDTAIVTSNTVINLPDGSTQKDIHTYAVDRVDFGPVELAADKQESLVPEDRKSTYEPHDGLAFSWPMDPPKDGTALYDSVTRTAQPATFVEETTLEGRDVYQYKVDAAGPITSPSVLGQFKDFPKQLPKAAVAGLLQAGVVPEASRDTLEAALPSLPDMIDIGFGSTNVVDATVDTEFGAPLKVNQRQGMYVTVPVNGQDVPTMPLSIIDIHTADPEVSTATDTMAKNSTMLSMLGTWLPIALVLIGIGLIALAMFRWHKPTHPRTNTPSRTTAPAV